MIVSYVGQALERHRDGRSHYLHHFRGADRGDSLRAQFMDQRGEEGLDRPRAIAKALTEKIA